MVAPVRRQAHSWPCSPPQAPGTSSWTSALGRPLPVGLPGTQSLSAAHKGHHGY